MPEKSQFGNNRNAAIIRTPQMNVTLVKWDWTIGQRGKTYDLTKMVYQWRWQKTIKTPQSGAQITSLPQTGSQHFLDVIDVMDVIQIWEFGVLKFQGFVRSIDASGTINSDGTPARMISIKASGFGTLLLEGQLGVNLFLKLEKFANIAATMTAFVGRLSDVINDDRAGLAEVTSAVVSEWYTYLINLGAKKFVKYLDTFLDTSTGMSGKRTPGYPRDLKLFRAEDETMTIWSIIQKICEAPFNEVWFDNGPRTVHYEANARLNPTRPIEVTLPGSATVTKTYMVLRSTPFNGTTIDGVSMDVWDSLPAQKVPLGYLVKFNLSKTMEESFSFYLVQPTIPNVSDLTLVATGAAVVDFDALDKYLFRPLTKQQYYARNFDLENPNSDANAGSIFDTAQDSAITLKNWYEKNDQYLSGVLTFMVPSNAEHDPRIGNKIEIEGMEGSFFYAEGVAHSWSYNGTMKSDVSVTRGYGVNAPVQLTDKIFKRGKFAMNEDFTL